MMTGRGKKPIVIATLTRKYYQSPRTKLASTASWR